MLGQAKSTQQGLQSGILFLNNFLAEIRGDDPPFGSMTADYVAHDHMRDLLLGLAHWASVTLIPKANGGYLTTSTVLQYFGRAKIALHQKFCDHPCWEGKSPEDQGPDWYQSIYERLKVALDRAKIQSDEGCTSPKFRALYKRVEPSFVRADRRSLSGWSKQAGVDLESICSQMMESMDADTYTFRAILVMTYLGVGRGGETKFLRWDNWLWDHHFECPDIIWAEMKTTNWGPMLFGPNAKTYLCDFYHSFGCYFAIEKGLFRENDQASKASAKYVFPNLHQSENDTVTRKVTERLRKFVAAELQISTSARSLRRGANTFLAVHPQISPEEQRIRGGWSSGTTTERYTEINPALTLPGMLALGGWSDPHAKVYAPRLECLSEPDDTEIASYFLEHLFLISVPQFKVDGKLHPMLSRCAASMIMYHLDVKSNHKPENPVVMAVVKAAKLAIMEWRKQAALSGRRVINTYLTHSRILDEFAEKIQKDFDARNHGMASVEDSTGIELMYKQAMKIDEQTKTINKLSNLTQRLEHGIEILMEEITEIKKRQLDMMTASQVELASGRPTQRPRIENVTELSSHRGQLLSAASIKQNSETCILNGKSTIEATGRGKNVSDVIYYFHEQKKFARFNGNLRLLHYPFIDKSNDNKLKAVMDLVELTWTKEQKKELMSSGLSNERALIIARQIDKQCMEKMAALENKPVGKSQPTILGLGARFVKHTKKHAEAFRMVHASGTHDIRSIMRGNLGGKS